MRLSLVALLVATAAAGPTSFASLRIAAGVREAGMGGAGTATALGPQAIAWNPAASADGPAFAATAAYAKWLLDTHHQSLFLSRNFGPAAFGSGVTSFSAGEFEYRVDPTEAPIGTFSPTDMSFYLNAARAFGSMVQLGVTGRYYYARVMDSDGQSVGIDLGARVEPLDRLVIGAALIDFGKTMAYEREVFWLPTRAAVGLGYSLVPLTQTQLTFCADGIYSLYPKKFESRLGLECAWHDLSFRAGYAPLNTNPLSFGLGVRLAGFTLNYALSPMTMDLGAVHRISVGFQR